MTRSRLRAWFSAADHGTTRMTDDGGGLISSLIGRTNGLTLTAAGAARPLWTPGSDFLAYPGLYGDGVAMAMVNTAFSSVLPVGNTPGWVLLIATPVAQPLTTVLFSYGGGTAGTVRRVTHDGANHLQIGDGNLAEFSLEDATVVIGPRVIIATYDTNTFRGRYDGHDTNPPSFPMLQTLNTGTTRFRIFANSAGTAAGFYNGYIHELLFFAGLPSADDILYAEEWAHRLIGRKNQMPVSQKFSTRSNYSNSITDVYYMPITGQSDSNGGIDGNVLTVTPRDPGRGSIWLGGARPTGLDQGSADIDIVLTADQLSSFVDAVEVFYGTTGETFCSLAAHRTLALLPSSAACVYTTHGISGAGYNSLKRGTTPYINLMAGVARAVAIAREEGDRYVVHVPFVIFVGGEADFADPLYADKLIEFQADLDRDIRSVTQSETPVKLVISQEARNDNALARLAQLEVALADPDKFVCIGPRYDLSYIPDEEGGTTAHLNAVGVAQMGVNIGKTIGALLNGTQWVPLYCSSAVRTGNVIDLTFAGGVGNLVLDTTVITPLADGNYGIEWRQTGGISVQIAPGGVAITGPTTIRVTLTGNPVSPSYEAVSIAQRSELPGGTTGPIEGSRANFRDSDTDTEVINGVTYSIRRYVAHQVKETVPV